MDSGIVQRLILQKSPNTAVQTASLLKAPSLSGYVICIYNTDPDAGHSLSGQEFQIISNRNMTVQSIPAAFLAFLIAATALSDRKSMIFLPQATVL